MGGGASTAHRLAAGSNSLGWSKPRTEFWMTCKSNSKARPFRPKRPIVLPTLVARWPGPSSCVCNKSLRLWKPSVCVTKQVSTG